MQQPHTQPAPPPATPTADALGVVIVSYNTCALLACCLASLHTCTLPLRVVVVDNASHDGSVDMVARDFPHVTVLAQPQNIGFAAANNIGMAWLGLPAGPTAPPAVLLLNPDTEVHAGAIEALAAFLHAHPRVGVVAPRLCNPDGSIQRAAFRFPTLSMTLLDLFPPGEVLPGRLYDTWWHGRYPYETGDPHAPPFPIDHPLGAAMLVRQATIAEVGLLDPAYFMYSEEVDWCWRIRQAGWAIWQVPAASVLHVGGAATHQFRSRMLVELHRSRVRFYQQHYPPAHLWWHRRIVQAGMTRLALWAWQAYLRGIQDRQALREQLFAYGQVCRL
jgi:GT2 family glycosyltransferase